MKLEHTVVLDAPKERVWSFVIDVPNVARCMPGVDEIEALGDGRYGGLLTVKLGPIQLGLRGTLSIVQRDDALGTATMRADAADARVGGSVKATMDLSVAKSGNGRTELRIATDAQLLGRIGELGQGLIRRKADQMMGTFAENVRTTFARDAAGS